MKIEGEVEDDSFAEQIAINENPLFVELSAKKLPFSEEIKLKNGLNEIKIKTADLVGRVSEKKIRVIADFEGPIVNISNYVDGQYAAERNIVLKGVIADATGIINLKISDKVFKYNKQEKAEFEVPFGLTEGNNRIPIIAVDAAGNTTRGELNILHAQGSVRGKNIPTHQYKKPEPIRLAFQGSGILDIGRHRLFAAALPGDKATDLKLNLKDIIDSQTVFFDTIYIDGSVTCSSEVKSVRINGSPLYVIPGRTIYFNRIIELQEGENKVAIEAQDAGGNLVSKTVSIIRQVPKVHQAGSRISLAILPFEIKGETSTVSSIVYDNIISSFFDLNRFNIVSRGDELEAALKELKLSATDLVDKSKAVQVGKLVAAEGILTGSIRETKNSIEIYARLLNTETSSLFEAKDVYGQSKSLTQVKYLTDGLALKFKHSFPLIDGLVIKVSGNSIYADFGSIHHIKKDMKFIVFREGAPVIHPVTGKALGKETEELGVARVINVFEEMSLGKLEADFDPNKIMLKDLIITK
jgi:TolB-like protein